MKSFALDSSSDDDDKPAVLPSFKALGSAQEEANALGLAEDPQEPTQEEIFSMIYENLGEVEVVEEEVEAPEVVEAEKEEVMEAEIDAPETIEEEVEIESPPYEHLSQGNQQQQRGN
jgi:hypothetical protein